MTNRFGVVLHSESVRWAAAEGVSETVIAAVLLLHERTVDEIVAKLAPGELEQVIKLVRRSPSCYPPGTLDALKGRRQTPAPDPVPSISTSSAASARSAARIKPGAEDLRRAHQRRLARLRVHAPQSTFEHERAIERATPAKTGTRRGTRAETARRRMVVEDLRNAGLSDRMISSATGIPVDSVHRAMRAVARAEAKKDVAVAEITKEILGYRLHRSARGQR